MALSRAYIHKIIPFLDFRYALRRFVCVCVLWNIVSNLFDDS